MKTIKTLAGEIGVTKQAVFQKMKKEPLASDLSNLITKIGGTVYVCSEGESLIKNQFYKTQKVLDATRADDDLVNVVRDSMDALQDQLARKDRQLDILNLHISVKGRQIDNLNRRIEDLSAALILAQEQTKAAQALHAGDIRRETLEVMMQSQKVVVEKERFWKRVFGSKEKQA